MIAVLASANVWADVQAVAGDRRCILAHDHDELLRLAGDVDAVVIAARNLEPVLGVVRLINRDHPLLPVILIIEQDSADLQSLESVSVEAVLLQHQIMARLPVALKRSVGLAFALRALAEDCMRNEVIPPSVLHVVTCALSTAPPPRTVQHLARLVDSDPSTIRRHWRCGVNSHGIQRVKDLLDWLVLLRALSVKTPSLSWRSVAEGMGTHERTLRRMAVRLTGDTLCSLDAEEAQRLLESFAESLQGTFRAASS